MGRSVLIVIDFLSMKFVKKRQASVALPRVLAPAGYELSRSPEFYTTGYAGMYGGSLPDLSVAIALVSLG